uniref:Placenta-specific gene 8 protein-like n=1 Tax=Myripristis murdjan TaxID=586833 RepID=A0A667ZTR1_9TELE
MSAKTVVNQPKPFITTTYSNKWTSGICDCFEDLPQCCLACWCLPCFTCKTSHEAGECVCLPLLDAYGLIPPMTLSLRVSVRQRYGIEVSLGKGDMSGDCVYATFCNICSWCQMAREIKRRSHTLTVINAQPTMMASQPMIVTSQPGVAVSQPMVSSISTQGVLTSRIM